jgi:HlyD family secretion protein
MSSRWRLCGKSRLVIACAALCVAAGCGRSNTRQVQGYVEGEFVYVASAQAGRLDVLAVARGTQVEAGDPLFALDSQPEQDALDQAQGRLNQAQASLTDAKKGERPSEIDSINSQLQQARAGAEFSEKELARQEALPLGAGTAEDLDRARSTRDQDRQHVAQLEADLKTAELGSRPDQIAAAAANVSAMEAALAQAQWELGQKRQKAPQSGLVFDTMYRQGEWVDAGHPIVALLPPANVKVRTFVPETWLGGIHPGDRAQVIVDGMPQPIVGKVSFVSPQAEYTPPVIYSRESREKLVYMVELVFDSADAANLHPGQPVDVRFGS